MTKPGQEELYHLGCRFVVPRENIVKIIKQYGEALEFETSEAVESYFTGNGAAHDGYMFWPESWKVGAGTIIHEKFIFSYRALQFRVKNHTYVTPALRCPICIIRILRAKLYPYLRCPGY